MGACQLVSGQARHPAAGLSNSSLSPTSTPKKALGLMVFVSHLFGTRALHLGWFRNAEFWDSLLFALNLSIFKDPTKTIADHVACVGFRV